MRVLFVIVLFTVCSYRAYSTITMSANNSPQSSIDAINDTIYLGNIMVADTTLQFDLDTVWGYSNALSINLQNEVADTIHIAYVRSSGNAWGEKMENIEIAPVSSSKLVFNFALHKGVFTKLLSFYYYVGDTKNAIKELRIKYTGVNIQ